MKAAVLVAAFAVFARPIYAQSSTDSVWFRRQFSQYDLTGDGRPDTLLLRAVGKRVDSLRVDFVIRSGGRVVYHDRWLSTYYFQYDDPIDSIPEARKRATVFKHLREVLVASAFEPFEPGNGSGADDDSPQGTMSLSLALRAASDSLRRTGMNEDSIRGAAYPLAEQMRPDSALLDRAWRALVRDRPRTFTYFSGGEATQTIVWSSVFGTFVTVFACC